MKFAMTTARREIAIKVLNGMNIQNVERNVSLQCYIVSGEYEGENWVVKTYEAHPKVTRWLYEYEYGD